MDSKAYIIYSVFLRFGVATSFWCWAEVLIALALSWDHLFWYTIKVDQVNQYDPNYSILIHSSHALWNARCYWSNGQTCRTCTSPVWSFSREWATWVQLFVKEACLLPALMWAMMSQWTLQAVLALCQVLNQLMCKPNTWHQIAYMVTTCCRCWTETCTMARHVGRTLETYELVSLDEVIFVSDVAICEKITQLYI